MTKQEAFDKACKGLKSQGFRRSLGGSRCSYRDIERRCAVGWLLEGIELSLDQLTIDVSFLRNRNRQADTRLQGFDPWWLSELQSCHDAAFKNEVDDPEAMIQKLRAFAEEHLLDASVLIDAEEAIR